MEKLAESFMSSSVLAGMTRSHWETNQVCYEYPLRLLSTDIYDAETMIRRLRAVNIDAYKVRNPLFDSDLFSPNNHPQFRSRAGLCMENWTSQYPGAVAYSQGTVLFHHSVFQLDSCSYERLVERFDCLISELSR